MALGIGEKGKPMSEGTCYDKLRSLETKGCIEIIASERGGTRVRLRLPREIPGTVPTTATSAALTVDDLDFFESPDLRLAILRREADRCFYCLRVLTSDTFVIEHVVSRPVGANGYGNVVAACRSCNNRKGESGSGDFLRTLYQGGYLTDEDFAARVVAQSRTSAVGDPETAPVVGVEITPDLGETFWSALGRGLQANAGNRMSAARMKFKGDVRGVLFLRNGREITPIRGGHGPQVYRIDNSWMELKDVADMGYYVLPPDAFAPDGLAPIPRTPG